MRLAQGLRDDVVGSQRNTLLADLGQSEILKYDDNHGDDDDHEEEEEEEDDDN